MINKTIKALLFVALFICSASSFAQTNAPVEMADGLYQSGKIYVVVIVATVIFAGIITYLIMLDKKISKLEKDIKNK